MPIQSSSKAADSLCELDVLILNDHKREALGVDFALIVNGEAVYPERARDGCWSLTSHPGGAILDQYVAEVRRPGCGPGALPRTIAGKEGHYSVVWKKDYSPFGGLPTLIGGRKVRYSARGFEFTNGEAISLGMLRDIVDACEEAYVTGYE